MPNPIPNDDHIVRYLNKEKWCPRDRSGLQPSAFGDEARSDTGVSANWLEYYYRDDESKSLAKIDKTCGLETKESGRFLKLNVGKIKKAIGETNPPAAVIHDGDHHESNKSHAEIRPYIEAVFTALFLCAERHGEYLRVPS